MAPTALFGSRAEAITNTRRLLRNGDFASAMQQAQNLIERDDEDAEAYRLLGTALRKQGRIKEAQDAEEHAINLSMLKPALFEAAMSLAQGQLQQAEQHLRQYLSNNFDDAAALRMLAEVGARTGHLDAADRLLDKALGIAPDYAGAKALSDAIARLRLRGQPAQGSARSTVGLEDVAPEMDTEDAALKLYARAIRRFPEKAENWISYGHVLRSVGKQDDAVAAYRTAIGKQPTSGEAWYAIADLKAARFSPEDLEQLRSVTKSHNLPIQDKVQIEFALARASEQFGTTDEAFAHYQRANLLRRQSSTYNGAAITEHVADSKDVLTGEFFRQRHGFGEPSSDPIFILGMPRAGSTLIEQILASHPQVEATGELADIPNLANGLADGKTAAFDNSEYLSNLAKLDAAGLRRLGQSYLWTTGLRRRTMKPFFIDKMPNNWLHLGLILCILPNAKIVDARRHPMACGFSNYRQFFAQGQEFSYDLTDIGNYYRDYVHLLHHVQAVQPGRLYRASHERLVHDPEAEIRALLDHIGLPFDERCLRFHENRRTVRTASSEQVRRPINRQGLEEWTAYASWLEPLHSALGDVANSWDV